VVQNADGSISTVRSISIGEDGSEVLIPTVIGDKVVSDEKAIEHYRKTGQHLGRFRSAQDANAYAEFLHRQQAQTYGDRQGLAPGAPPPGVAAADAAPAAQTLQPKRSQPSKQSQLISEAFRKDPRHSTHPGLNFDRAGKASQFLFSLLPWLLGAGGPSSASRVVATNPGIIADFLKPAQAVGTAFVESEFRDQATHLLGHRPTPADMSSLIRAFIPGGKNK